MPQSKERFVRTCAQSLLMLYSRRQDEQHGGADDEDETEDDETDAVDDCSSNHPFLHQLLILVRLMT